MREEAGGLILGPYEAGAPVCYMDGPSDESEYELFQEDLERLEPHIESPYTAYLPLASPVLNGFTTVRSLIRLTVTQLLVPHGIYLISG